MQLQIMAREQLAINTQIQKGIQAMHEVRRTLCGHRRNFQFLNFIQSPCCSTVNQTEVTQHVNLQLFQFSVHLKVTAAQLKILPWNFLTFSNIFVCT